MTRKKKPGKDRKPPPGKKPAGELTTDEALARLFPKPLVDAVRRDLAFPSKPPKPSMDQG